MSLRGKAAIVGIGETPLDRLGSKPGEPRKSTAEYLAWASRLALEDAGLSHKDLHEQGLAAIYTTNHSQPFWPEEVASIIGFTPSVALAGGNGGASSVSLLGHAAAMIAAGVVDLILVIAAAGPPRGRGPVSSKSFSIVRVISGTSASGGAPASSSSCAAAR